MIQVTARKAMLIHGRLEGTLATFAEELDELRKEFTKQLDRVYDPTGRRPLGSERADERGKGKGQQDKEIV